MSIHITFSKAFWWSKNNFSVGFFWHISRLHFFHYVPCWLYPLCIVSQYYKTRSINFNFLLLTMARVFCKTFKILAKNGVLIVFLTILTWMCAYSNIHIMVTRILVDATIQYWHGNLTHNIFYLCFLCFICFLLLLMSVAMVF
jgi:hypothetical protein